MEILMVFILKLPPEHSRALLWRIWWLVSRDPSWPPDERLVRDIRMVMLFGKVRIVFLVPLPTSTMILTSTSTPIPDDLSSSRCPSILIRSPITHVNITTIRHHSDFFCPRGSGCLAAV